MAGTAKRPTRANTADQPVDLSHRLGELFRQTCISQPIPITVILACPVDGWVFPDQTTDCLEASCLVAVPSWIINRDDLGSQQLQAMLILRIDQTRGGDKRKTAANNATAMPNVPDVVSTIRPPGRRSL